MLSFHVISRIVGRRARFLPPNQVRFRMTRSVVLRVCGLLAFAALVSCADSIPVEPTAVVARTKALALADAESKVRDLLTSINQDLAAAGANYALVKAEFLVDTAAWDGAIAPQVFANNRWKGFGMEWVPGDSRLVNPDAITYAYTIEKHPQPIGRIPTPPGLALIPFPAVRAQLDRAMESWLALSCTRRPVEFVDASGVVNGDFWDDFIVTRPKMPEDYQQPADIVQAGWLNPGFFNAFAPNGGSFIIGITLTEAFVGPDGFATDIDHNHKADIKRSEIYYNRNFAYGTNLAPNVVDLFSVIAHETGHALGLNHFGRIFALNSGAQEGRLTVSPRALMNAAYLGPTSQASTDISAYCSIFGRDIK
jgi:hypothetical protein